MVLKEKNISEINLLRGCALYRNIFNYVEYYGIGMVIKCIVQVFKDRNTTNEENTDIFYLVQGISKANRKYELAVRRKLKKVLP